MPDAASFDPLLSPCFDVAIADKIATITLKRPEAHNAMTADFWADLPRIVRHIDANALARVIVIQSTGKHFSSGMDVSVFASGGLMTASPDPAIRAEAFRREVKRLQGTFSCLEDARMPVLCAVQGGCIGGAVDLATACDIRWATADAFFVIQEINIGMVADVGTFPRLAKLIPEGWVRELAFTGRRLAAEAALNLGLVNAVFPDQAAMLAHVHTIAREIAEKTPLAVTGSKAILNYARNHGVDATLDYLATWQAGMFAPHHIMEAFAAKAEKRVGAFPDLVADRDHL